MWYCWHGHYGICTACTFGGNGIRQCQYMHRIGNNIDRQSAGWQLDEQQYNRC
jgi:hypothetical protein